MARRHYIDRRVNKPNDAFDPMRNLAAPLGRSSAPLHRDRSLTPDGAEQPTTVRSYIQPAKNINAFSNREPRGEKMTPARPSTVATKKKAPQNLVIAGPPPRSHNISCYTAAARKASQIHREQDKKTSDVDVAAPSSRKRTHTIGAIESTKQSTVAGSPPRDAPIQQKRLPRECTKWTPSYASPLAPRKRAAAVNKKSKAPPPKKKKTVMSDWSIASSVGILPSINGISPLLGHVGVEPPADTDLPLFRDPTKKEPKEEPVDDYETTTVVKQEPPEPREAPDVKPQIVDKEPSAKRRLTKAQKRRRLVRVLKADKFSTQVATKCVRQVLVRVNKVKQRYRPIAKNRAKKARARIDKISRERQLARHRIAKKKPVAATSSRSVGEPKKRQKLPKSVQKDDLVFANPFYCPVIPMLMKNNVSESAPVPRKPKDNDDVIFKKPFPPPPLPLLKKSNAKPALEKTQSPAPVTEPKKAKENDSRLPPLKCPPVPPPKKDIAKLAVEKTSVLVVEKADVIVAKPRLPPPKCPPVPPPRRMTSTPEVEKVNVPEPMPVSKEPKDPLRCPLLPPPKGASLPPLKCPPVPPPRMNISTPAVETVTNPPMEKNTASERLAKEPREKPDIIVAKPPLKCPPVPPKISTPPKETTPIIPVVEPLAVSKEALKKDTASEQLVVFKPPPVLDKKLQHRKELKNCQFFIGASLVRPVRSVSLKTVIIMTEEQLKKFEAFRIKKEIESASVIVPLVVVEKSNMGEKSVDVATPNQDEMRICLQNPQKEHSFETRQKIINESVVSAEAQPKKPDHSVAVQADEE